MNLFLAVTDNNWLRFLRNRAPLEEVNFWRPGGAAGFRALHPGEPLLFKLHAPENFVVGGGFFAHFSREVPRDWSPNIVQGKGYDSRSGEGARLWHEVRLRIEAVSFIPEDELAKPLPFGEPYYPFDGQEIWLPPDPREHPKREFLEWHGDVVFRG